MGRWGGESRSRQPGTSCLRASCEPSWDQELADSQEVGASGRLSDGRPIEGGWPVSPADGALHHRAPLPLAARGDAAPLLGVPSGAARYALFRGRYALFTALSAFSAASGLPPCFPACWRTWRVHPGLVLSWQWRSPRN